MQADYYGCVLTSLNITSFTANYQKTGDIGDSCAWWRCGGGVCSSLSGKRTGFPNGVCPAFAKWHVVRVDYGLFNVCWGSSPLTIPSCSA